MGVPAVQTIFLAATVFFKYAMQLNMAPATGLAMIVATVYMVFIYPRAWKVIINTLPRDIKAGIRLARVLLRVKLNERANLTVPDLFGKTVKKTPQKVAIILEGQEWTFKQLDEFSNQVANYFLAKGYAKGDTVALCMENTPEFVGIWLGLAKIGVVPALLNYNLRQAQLYHCIKIASSKAVIYHSSFVEAFDDIAADLGAKFPKFIVNPSPQSGVGGGGGDSAIMDFHKEVDGAAKSAPLPKDPPGFHDKLVYIYTSGTTGMPKAAVVKHARFMYLASAVHYMTEMNGDDVIYDPLPLYHTAGGMVGIGQVMVFGLTAVVRRKFSASQFWAEAKAHNCTVAQYIGEICRYLLSSPERPEDRTHKVRVMFGNGLRPQIWEPFQKRFGVDRICEFYGSTEGNANIINMEGKVGAVGFKSLLLPGVLPIYLIKVSEESGEPIRDENGMCIECQPGEPGEFVGRIQRNHPLRDFDGYADEQATKKKILRDVRAKGDIFFRSGDVLVMDEFGYFYFRDRTGDTFRWRGENVSTSEVEGVLSNLLDHKDCVVYGVEVPCCEGRAGMAAVHDPDDTADLGALARGMRKSLAPFARPVFVRKVRQLDSTGTYKLKKLDLQHEAFDKERVKDPLYFLDPSSGSYVPLDDALYDKILAVDCFRNYSASEVFIQGLARQTDQQDVEAILTHQKDLMQRYEKTNEMLVNSTTVSAMRSQNALQDFRKHVQMLKDMKKDLDGIFRKIRSLKTRIKDRYPEAYAVAENRITSMRTKSEDDSDFAAVAPNAEAGLDDAEDVREVAEAVSSCVEPRPNKDGATLRADEDGIASAASGSGSLPPS